MITVRSLLRGVNSQVSGEILEIICLEIEVTEGLIAWIFGPSGAGLHVPQKSSIPGFPLAQLLSKRVSTAGPLNGTHARSESGRQALPPHLHPIVLALVLEAGDAVACSASLRTTCGVSKIPAWPSTL